MNTLTISPSPNWYETSVLACAPDGTLIYGARNDIIVVQNPVDSTTPADVQIIPRAHSQKVVSLNINRNWGSPFKYFVSVGEDKLVKVWNAETLKRKVGHNCHLNHGKVVAATFAGDERVISVSEEGVIVIWNINTNETKVVKDVFSFKATVTCMSTCPHATWLTAFGLKNGLVVVTDLRKNGRILYKLRGHEKSVISLAWCPVPVNIFPKNPNSYVGTKQDYFEFNGSTESTKSETSGSIKVTKSETTSSLEAFSHSSDSCNNSKLKDPGVQELSTSNLNEKTDLITNLVNNEDIHKKAKKIIYESEEIKETISNISQYLKSHSNHSEANVLLFNLSEEVRDDFLKEYENFRYKLLELDSLNISAISSNNAVHVVSEKEKPERISVEEQVEEQPTREFLLASSAKEGNIYIWRAGTDGRMQTFFTVPGFSRNRQKFEADKCWITLFWATPTMLLSSSRNAELLQWALPKPKNKSKLMTILHNDHNSTLFNIAGPTLFLNEYNWLKASKLNVWTTGQDRLLLNTSLGPNRTNLACYSTLGGSIPCMQLSPVDPNRLALGTGDGKIKIWDLSRPHIRHINMTVYYNKIQGKVETIAWHPTMEEIIAYGTSEGRVGCIDTNKPRNNVVFRHFFKKQIHKVEWGPTKENKGQYGLFVVSEGNLVMFSLGKPLADPLELDKPENAFIYTFSWKPDYSTLLVTTKTGSLIIYSNDLKILSTHYYHSKMQHIFWHIEASVSDTKISKYCNWFADISGFTNVMVYDFEQLKHEKDEQKIIAKYAGVNLISSIAWSPYDANLMVIACETGVALVWNVTEDKIISTYINPNFEAILSVTWSPIDSDFIIIGNRDNTLRVWKVSEYPPKDVKDTSDLRKKVLNDITRESNDLLPKKEEKLVAEEKEVIKRGSRSGCLPSFYFTNNPPQLVADMRNLKRWKEQPAEMNSFLEERSNPHQPDIFDIFGTNADMVNLVRINEKRLKERGKHSAATYLSLFRGDISTSIKEAIQEKRVNAQILSLAPMVSPKLWQEACGTYAQQLAEEPESHPLEIASFYLACHKVQEAIDTLCDGLMYKEALALAKCRLLDNDEAISSVLEKWAQHALFAGSYEIAAQCYITLGRYDDAASVLFRRSNSDILEFAAELVENHENDELHKAIMTRLKAFKDFKENQSNALKKESDLVNKAETLLEALVGKPEVDTAHPQINDGGISLNGSTSYTDTSNTSEESAFVLAETENGEQTKLLGEVV